MSDNLQFSLKLVQSPCDNWCRMCYQSPFERKFGQLFTQSQLETIFRECQGATHATFLWGEPRGTYAKQVIQSVKTAVDNGIPKFNIINSGINLSLEELQQIVEIVPSTVSFQLSVDGRWGHRNWGPGAPNGDVLQKFVELRDSQPKDKVGVSVLWTHILDPKHQSKYDQLRDSYQKRCQEVGVHFGTGYAMGHGPTFNPWKAIQENGWESADPDVFTFCSLPVPKYNGKTNVVKVNPKGAYTLCQWQAPSMTVGVVGTMGTGGMGKAVENFYQQHPGFAQTMIEDGVMGFARKLYETPGLKAEVRKVLDQDYSKDYGGCDLCVKLLPYKHLLENK